MAKNDSTQSDSAHESQSGNTQSGADQVQENMDAEQEKGYRGTTPDPTPDEAYTVQGRIADMPTPETDPALADKAQAIADKNSANE